ncbi:MAG: Rpn family recombination-promoting nuclease/putative transposase [Spirochaetes bacterium]|nr:Rpn family recombination-promoting nuclease/putative transposase [Spirochaetota bacterium]
MNQEANEKHKDSFFSYVFGNKRAVRELCAALGGKPLPEDAVITMNTLVRVLFMGLANDISFLINGQLIVLIEHQSTINKSMPMRLLRYVVQLYENIVDKEAYYRRGAITIPTPVFIVLYNGTDPYPDS